jgi:hypothetical protein
MSDNATNNNGANQTMYGSDSEFMELLKHLKTNEGHKGRLETYYKYALTEQQAKQLGAWLCGGTGEFWYHERAL